MRHALCTLELGRVKGAHPPSAYGTRSAKFVPKLPEVALESADCKRGRRKGATSKNVKKPQKVFRHFSKIFLRRAKNVKNRQKVSKSFSTLFDNFRAAPFFRPLLGGCFGIALVSLNVIGFFLCPLWVCLCGHALWHLSIEHTIGQCLGPVRHRFLLSASCLGLGLFRLRYTLQDFFLASLALKS